MWLIKSQTKNLVKYFEVLPESKKVLIRIVLKNYIEEKQACKWEKKKPINVNAFIPIQTFFIISLQKDPSHLIYTKD